MTPALRRWRTERDGPAGHEDQHAQNGQNGQHGSAGTGGPDAGAQVAARDAGPGATPVRGRDGRDTRDTPLGHAARTVQRIFGTTAAAGTVAIAWTTERDRWGTTGRPPAPRSAAATETSSDTGLTDAARVTPPVAVLDEEVTVVVGGAPEGTQPPRPPDPPPGGPPGVSGESPAEGSEPISSKAFRGASFLFGREALGSIVRLIGVIVTVRLIGPSGYGVFTGAAAFVAVVVTICQMGAEVYLIRAKETPSDRMNNEIFSLLLVTSLAAMLISLALTVVFESFLRPVGVVLPLRVLLLCVPINVLWAPAQGYLERRFDYKKIGILELGGDIVLYATAIPLAIAGFGAWSLVIGYFAWQTFLLVGSIVLAGLRPRWAWSSRTARQVVRHGTSYSTATLFVNLAVVVNPMVVGTFVGAAGVGYVSFARNLVQTVGFAKRSAYRLGIVTMSQIRRENPSQFRQGLERGTFLLTLGMAVPFAVFGLFAHWIIPGVFGHEWTASIPVYCLLSAGALLGSIPQIESSLFYALGRNGVVAFSAFLNTALLAVLSVGLVKLWGVNGFGVASVLAMVSYLWMHYKMRRLTHFHYRLTFVVTLITLPAMFLPVLPPPVGLALLVPWVAFLFQPLRREVFGLLTRLRSSLQKKFA